MPGECYRPPPPTLSFFPSCGSQGRPNIPDGVSRNVTRPALQQCRCNRTPPTQVRPPFDLSWDGVGTQRRSRSSATCSARASFLAVSPQQNPANTDAATLFDPSWDGVGTRWRSRSSAACSAYTPLALSVQQYPANTDAATPFDPSWDGVGTRWRSRSYEPSCLDPFQGVQGFWERGRPPVLLLTYLGIGR
jgi:hypothetical protein